jgi:Mg/Co/Ni transporter MgtE
MRIRIDSRLTDLAGSGLVLLGFLLAALALSAAPVVLRSLGVRPASAGPAPMISPALDRRTALT